MTIRSQPATQAYRDGWERIFRRGSVEKASAEEAGCRLVITSGFGGYGMACSEHRRGRDCPRHGPAPRLPGQE